MPRPLRPPRTRARRRSASSASRLDPRSSSAAERACEPARLRAERRSTAERSVRSSPRTSAAALAGAAGDGRRTVDGLPRSAVDGRLVDVERVDLGLERLSAARRPRLSSAREPGRLGLEGGDHAVVEQPADVALDGPPALAEHRGQAPGPLAELLDRATTSATIGVAARRELGLGGQHVGVELGELRAQLAPRAGAEIASVGGQRREPGPERGDLAPGEEAGAARRARPTSSPWRRAASAWRSSGRSWRRTSRSRSCSRSRLASVASSRRSAFSLRLRNFRTPAASSMIARRSSGRALSTASIWPWLTITCCWRPTPVSESSSWMSSRRHGTPLIAYSLSPVRNSVRLIVTSVNSIGRRPDELSIVSATSARPSAGRLAVPAKMTSSIFWLRTALGRLRAEHPGDGVDHVRLAGAVRPDDDGDARLELERRGVGEGLEALEGERLEEHGDPTLIDRPLRTD